MNKYLKLYSSCFLVDGYLMCLIIDTDRGCIYDIPKPIYNLIKKITTNSYDEFLSCYEGDVSILEKFINQFINEELFFFTNSPESFPEINLDWASPHYISNSVLHIKDLTSYDIGQVIEESIKLGCQHFQIIIESNVSFMEIKTIISFFKDSRVKSIELLLPEDNQKYFEKLDMLISIEPRLAFIIIYNCNLNKVIKRRKDGRFIEIRKKDIRIRRKEIVSIERFSINLQVYIESQNYNTGLNAKVTIMSNGNVLNYSSHDTVFGNIKSADLKEILQSTDFSRKWHIKNDMIEKCKDCQYRYICVNNSDILEKNGLFYKKEKCNFNPYKNIWEI